MGLQNWPALALAVGLAAALTAALRGPLAYAWLGAAPALVALGIPWPAPAAIAVGATVLAAGRHRRRLVHSALGQRTGKAPHPLSLVLVAVVTAAACVVLAGRQLADHWMYVPREHPGPIVLGLLVVGAAGVNSLAEEFVWRGILWTALEESGLRRWSTVASSAASFGLSHGAGLPGGVTGVAAATVFGVLLGGVRHLSGSLRGCVLIHMVADVCLFSVYAQHLVFRQ